MVLTLRTAAFAILLLFSTAATAQVGVSFPILSNVTPGSIISVPLSVYEFDSIASMQFAVRWDPAVLEFQALTDFNLPNLDLEDFNLLMAVDSGKLFMAWTAPGTDTNGVSKPDGAIIYKIRFKVIGPLESGTPVYFSENLPFLVFEIADENNNFWSLNGLNPADVHPGFVAVGYTVAAPEALDQTDMSARVFPNPFAGQATLELTLPERAALQLAVHTTSGSLVAEKTVDLPAGRHRLPLTSFLPSAQKGVYMLTLRTGSRQCMLPLCRM